MFFFWSFTQSDCGVQIVSASMLTQLLFSFSYRSDTFFASTVLSALSWLGLRPSHSELNRVRVEDSRW